MTVKRTSSFVSRVIAISLLLIAVTTATAQSRKDATADKKLTAQKDTVAFFRGVAVSADVVGLAQLAFSDYGQYEAALRINLKDRYFPVFELGYGTADSDNPTTNLKYKTRRLLACGHGLQHSEEQTRRLPRVCRRTLCHDLL